MLIAVGYGLSLLVQKPFNSLFEMRPSPPSTASLRNQYLSILYLRCLVIEALGRLGRAVFQFSI